MPELTIKNNEFTKYKLRLNLDTVAYTKKPENTDTDPFVIDNLVNRLKNPQAQSEITLSGLFDKIISGHTFTPALLNGKSNAEFIQQQLIVFDLDNSTNPDVVAWETPQSACEKLKSWGYVPNFVYPSFSNTPERPKFRLVCTLSEVVTDPAVITKLYDSVIAQFPAETKVKPHKSDPNQTYTQKVAAIDRGAKALSIMFYGTCNGYYPELCEHGYTDLKTVLQLYKEPEPIRLEIKCRPNNYTDSTPAHELYETAPLMPYLTQTMNFSRIKGSGTQYRLSPCVVCGGNDDFSVNTDKGQWICHRTKESGTIYRIMTEYQNMTPDTARDEIKRLHGIDPEQERKDYAQAKEQADRDAYFNSLEPPLERTANSIISPIDVIEPERKGMDNTDAPTRPKVRSFADVVPKKQDWWWYPFIRNGAVNTFTALQGTGKSFLAGKAAAEASLGRRLTLPFQSLFYGDIMPWEMDCEPETTLLLNAEDDPDTETVHRLMAMGADLNYVKYVDVSDLNINVYDPCIEAWIKEVNPTSIWLDPIQQFFSGKDPHGTTMNMNDSASVRPALTHLKSIARRHNKAIVLICHPNKNNLQNALQSTMGSNDFTAAPRSAVYIGLNPDNKEQRIMTLVKSNSVPDKHKKSLAYEFDMDNGGIVFAGESDLQADDVKLFSKSKAKPDDEKKTAIEEAQITIDEAIETHGGCATSQQVQAYCTDKGISKPTMYRAKEKMTHVKSTRRGAIPVYWYFEGNDPSEQMKMKGTT